MRLAAPFAGNRGRLAAFLAERPGAGMGEAARALGIDHSTVAYHVRRLEKAGAIVTERCGRYVRLYVNGDRPRPPSEPPAGSRREACLSYVRAHPGADVEAVAEAAQISRQAAWVHLRSLAADDVIELEYAGGRLRVRPTREEVSA